MQKRNSVLLKFVHGLSGDTVISVSKVRAVEQLYYVCNGSFVAPFSFANLLMLYFATGSKTAVSLLSSGLPCGSYSTLQVYAYSLVLKKIYTQIKLIVIFITIIYSIFSHNT